jgi:hypothetical protein
VLAKENALQIPFPKGKINIKSIPKNAFLAAPALMYVRWVRLKRNKPPIKNDRGCR